MINYTAKFSPETYQWLQQSADALNASIDVVLESLVRRHSEHPDSLNMDEATCEAEPNGTTNPAQASEIDALSTELEDEMAQLIFLNDDELWQAARTQLDTDAHTRMENLLFKQQSTGLDEHEIAEAETLANRYDRTMLIRAKAAVLLQQRGHDISVLSSASTS